MWDPRPVRALTPLAELAVGYLEPGAPTPQEEKFQGRVVSFS